MIPWPIKVRDLPPGALIADLVGGPPRQAWFVPPMTVVVAELGPHDMDPDGTIIMFVDDVNWETARAVAMLSAVFGPLTEIPNYPMSE